MFRPASTTTLPDAFIKGLACAALHPALRSILVFDAPNPALEWIANTLAEMLRAIGCVVKQVRIAVSEQDDDLWGSLVLSRSAKGLPVAWHQGLFAGEETDHLVRLVCIPDLTTLSLATIRACVMLMGADVVNLERYGQHKQWHPNICWVAGSATPAVGSISPHLLDRFALRLNWRGAAPQKSAAELLQEVLNEHNELPPYVDTAPALPALASDIKEHITQAAQHWAEPTAEARERVLSYMMEVRTYTPRREIALARLALAHAQLEGASHVIASHVDAAAQLIDLAAPVQPAESTASSLPSSSSSYTSTSTTPDTSYGSTATGFSSSQDGSPDSSSQEPVYPANTTVIPDEAPVDISPYPEDKAPVRREAASLRLPFFHNAASRVGRGPIVGVEQAWTLRDLAVVSTLFAAAPFQPIRHYYRRDDRRPFILYPTDLRSYRRAPVAEHMLLLLLDYTSLRECGWQKALLPYLREAYADRASICIVQVGAAHPTDELRASVVSARSVLVPSITAALEAERGKATPLAHGMDLAIRTLRHALQHGRSTVQQALFVVISDGRGNISIEASRSGYVGHPINRQGIEDTLQIAKSIHNLKGVHTVLLNPQPKHYPELPLTLAGAMGAEVVNIPPLAGVEV